MNTYKVRLQSDDGRLFEVTIKADSLSDDGFMVRFWRKAGPFGWFRRVVHYVRADVLMSIFCSEYKP